MTVVMKGRKSFTSGIIQSFGLFSVIPLSIRTKILCWWWILVLSCVADRMVLSVFSVLYIGDIRYIRCHISLLSSVLIISLKSCLVRFGHCKERDWSISRVLSSLGHCDGNTLCGRRIMSVLSSLTRVIKLSNRLYRNSRVYLSPWLICLPKVFCRLNSYWLYNWTTLLPRIISTCTLPLATWMCRVWDVC